MASDESMLQAQSSGRHTDSIIVDNVRVIGVDNKKTHPHQTMGINCFLMLCLTFVCHETYT